MSAATPLTWPSIARLALVQVAIGAVMVIMTSTLNRVMVVELGLAASIPGALVAVHFAVQLLRPKLGFRSDAAGTRLNWIVGGMALVAVAGFGAAAATALMEHHRALGLGTAVLAFVGLGVGSARPRPPSWRTWPSGSRRSGWRAPQPSSGSS
jgi:MFS transporter, BCD family, chlorophyll transporter